MLDRIISRVLAVFKSLQTMNNAYLAGEIVNNQLNPTHLAIATAGYRIQTETFHIPDRFGFFVAGPPRLQVRQAALFIHVIQGICLSLVLWGFVVLILRSVEPVPAWKLIMILFAMVALEKTKATCFRWWSVGVHSAILLKRQDTALMIYGLIFRRPKIHLTLQHFDGQTAAKRPTLSHQRHGVCYDCCHSPVKT